MNTALQYVRQYCFGIICILYYTRYVYIFILYIPDTYIMRVCVFIVRLRFRRSIDG